jgi:hypothetical protein
MNILVGTGICSFVLASLWTYLSVAAPAFNLVAWVGFTGWACHFAAGGGATGLQKALASNVAGGIWAWIALNVFRQAGGGAALLGLLVGIIALFMVLQAHLSWLSFIPGAFLGAGTWFGATAGRDGAALTAANVMVIGSMIIGAFLGYLNEAGGKKLSGTK